MISVVTAYYNSHDFIGKAFESLKAQSYECWEWIIVDDGSRPEAVAALNIIIGNEERVRVLTQKNAGQGAARNRGAREAKGDFLCFLDSDDWFDSHKLEKQLAFMRENKSDLSFTGVEGVRLNGCKENFSGISHFDQKRGREFLPGLIKNCLFTLSSVMITKSCFDELGGFSSESEFRGTEDYELWVRAAAADKDFAFIPERLTYYNIRYGSEVRDLIRSYDGTLRAIRPLKNDAESYDTGSGWSAKCLSCRQVNNESHCCRQNGNCPLLGRRGTQGLVRRFENFDDVRRSAGRKIVEHSV